MKKVLILIALVTLPVLSFGQNTSSDTSKQNDVLTFEMLMSSQESEGQMALGTYTKIDVTNLSYKKSNELISIKAYRKSLQIRVKEVKTC